MINQISIKIDKSKWSSHRFNDIAFNISERVEPTNTELEIYVGLEHLDAESIHIKRFGKRTDVKGTKLKVYPGDIIFGRRRAYQRKAAIAEFEGFCSAHALVLRANPEVIDPSLFPFFLHSDSFMNRAIDISVGSLSPTINWGTLKKEKFLLPPKDQQAKIAELLWAAEKSLENNYNLLNLLKVNFRTVLNNDIKFTDNKYLILKNLISYRKGITYKAKNYTEINDENGIPLLNLKSIERYGGFNPEGIKYYNGPHDERHFVKDDDLIIACTDITREGNVVGFPLDPNTYKDKKMLFTMDLIAIKPNREKISIPFLYYLLRTNWAHWFFYARSPGTTVLHLDVNAALKLKIPEIPLIEQEIIVSKLNILEHSIVNVTINAKYLADLKKSLINYLI